MDKIAVTPMQIVRVLFVGSPVYTRRMASANRTPWRVLYLKQGDEMLLDFFIDDPDESFGYTK